MTLWRRGRWPRQFERMCSVHP